MGNIRKIGGITRAYRHFNRYRQIVGVVIKYGFGDLLETLKLDGYMELGAHFFSGHYNEKKMAPLGRPQRLRMALEELGATFIKLGQILSTRPDLMPQEYIKELSRLQDHVMPVPYASIKRIVEDSYKQLIEEVFAQFDPEPIASASIGQVHKAVLFSGETVAVKCRRPGVKKQAEIDLEILYYVAELIEKYNEDLALQQPTAIIEEFATILYREMDYANEASNMQRASFEAAHIHGVFIPKVYTTYINERVLVSEFIDGVKISKADELHAMGINIKEIINRGTDLILNQVLIFGFFHADPHPGNIFVTPDNRICLLDFGMVGIVDRQTRENFVELIEGVVKRDEVMVAKTLIQITTWTVYPNMREFERSVSFFLGKHVYKPLNEVQIGALLNDLLDMVTAFRLTIPSDLYLMIKCITTIEGIGIMLDPEYDLVEEVKPFMRRIKLERLSPLRIKDEVMQTSAQALTFISEFPHELMELTRILRRGKLSLTLEHKGFENMLKNQDQISNRVSFAIIIAALIIGSAVIIISDTPPIVLGVSLLGLIGFVTAFVMAVWLLIAILRRGKL